MTEQEWLNSTDPVAMLNLLTRRNAYPVGHPALAVQRPSDRKLRLVAVALAMTHNLKDRPEWREKYERAYQWIDGKGPPEPVVMGFTGEDARWHLYDDMPLKVVIDAITNFRRRLSLEQTCDILRDIIGNPFRPVTLPVGEVCGKCEGEGKILLRYYQQRDRPPDWRKCDTCHGTGHGPSPVLTPLVKSLAEAAYQERREDGTLDPDRLLVLSDALEEAGLPEWVECPCVESARQFGTKSKVCKRCLSPGIGFIGRYATGRQPHPLAHLREPGPHYRGCFAIDLLTGRN